MKKRFKISGELSLLPSLALGVAISTAALLVSALILSGILLVLKNPTAAIKPASLIIFLLCGAVSGFLTAKIKGKGGVAVSVISAFIFVVIMLLVALIVCRGKISGAALMNALCFMLTAALFAYFGRERKKNFRRRKHG